MARVFAFIGFLFSLVWAQSVRGRSVRLSILILGILGLAFAALSFNNVNIDIPGVTQLKRGGTGPLGLKLGLDLRGGGQLIYQADTGTRVDLSFESALEFWSARWPPISFEARFALAIPCNYMGRRNFLDTADKCPRARHVMRA